MSVRNIFSFFDDSKKQFDNHPALVVDDQTYTYNELSTLAGKICSILQTENCRHVAIFCSRSLSCYQGILGTLAAGKTYIPLNPKFPVSRNETIIRLAGIHTFIADAKGLQQLKTMENILPARATIILPQMGKKDIPQGWEKKFRMITSEDLTDSCQSFASVNQDKIAYIMFTSGSTGTPKGVQVTHKNVDAYIRYIRNRYELGPGDRFSQSFDLTFDLSVHDLFLTWSVGGSLHVIPEKVLFAPAKFIKDHQLTVWFSVPSLAQFMNRFRMLKENIFPSLRYSLFCGEPLPKALAVAWQKAAPRSILENIYGPTETTIGITHYRIPDEEEKILEHNGIVSIGQVFSTHEYRLIDEDMNLKENTGELCLSGPQVTPGYFNNPEKTAESFIKLGNDDRIWYRTGDLVKKEGENLFYISRKDFQVKIRGYRIELEEINHRIRNFTGCQMVYTVPYPFGGGMAEYLITFIDRKCKTDKKEIWDYTKQHLPEYMVPKKILFIDNFPLNANGKVDLKKLATEINKTK